jgi:sugar lactone lactonase YvrE
MSVSTMPYVIGPHGVATDAAGNVYVADTGNNTIRKITPDGVVTTLAGTAAVLGGSADGTGAAASFFYPDAVATDRAGNVFVADTGNQFIRKITPAGVVTTLAGTASTSAYGIAGGSADGSGAAARFNEPAGIATDSAGNVYVADTGNSTIRKITSDSVVTTLAGTAAVVGSADGSAASARFSGPAGLAKDSAGNVYVADVRNSTIREITPAGVVTTFAGTAGVVGSADGTGTAASFSYPNGVATDSLGNVYVADMFNDTVRKITPAGVVTTLAGTAGVRAVADGTGATAYFESPVAVAADSGGNVYVADGSAIRKITPAGVVTTFAGNGYIAGSADGTGAAARFNKTAGVATDSVGNVYVSDMYNNTVRKITPSGVVTTLAGTAGVVGSADGIGVSASFSGPAGLATDTIGNVYVADTQNNSIRRITTAGVVSTVVGAPGGVGLELGALPASLGIVSAVTVVSNNILAISVSGAIVLATSP